LKHVTIIGINFHPEDTAIGLYSTQLAEYLSENGYKVQVITGFPYYPAWRIREDYRKRKTFLHEKYKDIDIYRYKQYVPRNPRFLKRIIHLTDFTFGSYFNLSKIGQTDAVIAVIPFTTDALLGKILAKRKKAKLWIHIQDFEFDAAREARLSANIGFMFNILFRIEKKLLLGADKVTTISRSMLDKLRKKTGNRVPSGLFPNWIDTEFINPEKYKPHPYLQTGKFNILYAGNMGEKQDWDFFVTVVEKMANEDVAFVIVGDGAKKSLVKERLQNQPNVFFHSPVPYAELPDLLCSADVHVLFQKPDVVDTVMPSKILGMFASAKPSIITGNEASEVRIVTEESHGGLFFPGDTPEAVVRSIIELKNNPEKRLSLGENARRYVRSHFDRESVLSRFKKELDELLRS